MRSRVAKPLGQGSYDRATGRLRWPANLDPIPPPLQRLGRRRMGPNVDWRGPSRPALLRRARGPRHGHHPRVRGEDARRIPKAGREVQKQRNPSHLTVEPSRPTVSHQGRQEELLRKDHGAEQRRDGLWLEPHTKDPSVLDLWHAARDDGPRHRGCCAEVRKRCETCLSSRL